MSLTVRSQWPLLTLLKPQQEKPIGGGFNLPDIRVRVPGLRHSKYVLLSKVPQSLSHTPALALAPPQFELTVSWQTAIRHVPGEFVQLRVLGAAIYLSFFLCSAASVQAQDAPSSFLTWLHRISRTGAHHRAPLPPLPRPRPAELVPKPSEAAAPNKASGIPD